MSFSVSAEIPPECKMFLEYQSVESSSTSTDVTPETKHIDEHNRGGSQVVNMDANKIDHPGSDHVQHLERYPSGRLESNQAIIAGCSQDKNTNGGHVLDTLQAMNNDNLQIPHEINQTNCENVLPELSQKALKDLRLTKFSTLKSLLQNGSVLFDEEPTRYKCGLCAQNFGAKVSKFKSTKKLYNHLITIHKVTRFRCIICGYQNFYRVKVEKHQENVHKLYNTEQSHVKAPVIVVKSSAQSEKASDNTGSLATKREKPTKYKPNVINPSINDKQETQTSSRSLILQLKYNEIQCQLCKRTFTSKLEALKHLDIEHKAFRYRCSICGYRNHYRSMAERHIGRPNTRCFSAECLAVTVDDIKSNKAWTDINYGPIDVDSDLTDEGGTEIEMEIESAAELDAYRGGDEDMTDKQYHRNTVGNTKTNILTVGATTDTCEQQPNIPDIPSYTQIDDTSSRQRHSKGKYKQKKEIHLLHKLFEKPSCMKYSCGWCKFRAVHSKTVVRHHYRKHQCKELDVVRINLKSKLPCLGLDTSIGFSCDDCDFSGRFRHELNLHNDKNHLNSLNRDGITDCESDSQCSPIYPFFYYNSKPPPTLRIQNKYKLKDVKVTCVDILQSGMEKLVDLIDSQGIRKLNIDVLPENEFVAIATKYREDVVYQDTNLPQPTIKQLNGLEFKEISEIIQNKGVR